MCLLNCVQVSWQREYVSPLYWQSCVNACVYKEELHLYILCLLLRLYELPKFSWIIIIMVKLLIVSGWILLVSFPLSVDFFWCLLLCIGCYGHFIVKKIIIVVWILVYIRSYDELFQCDFKEKNRKQSSNIAVVFQKNNYLTMSK